MAKTAAWAVPDGEQKAPEGRQNRDTKNDNPVEADSRAQARSIRGAFARSICRANHLGTLKEQAACEDGVPCPKLSQCLGHADATIRYLDSRKAQKTDT